MSRASAWFGIRIVSVPSAKRRAYNKKLIAGLDVNTLTFAAIAVEIQGPDGEQEA
jgi:hypothetical protein